MNPVFIQIIKWALEKALIEAGKKIDWPEIKVDVDAKIDALIASRVYDAVGKYLVNKLLDGVELYFNSSAVPITPDVIHQAVESASQTLLGRVAAEFLKV